MPQLVRCDVLTPQQPPKNLPEQIEQQYRDCLRVVGNYLRDKFVTWQIDQKFKFELPSNIFQNRRQKPVVEFRRPQSTSEESQIKPLSPEQLESIRDSAEFIVTSPGQTIPFRWHINEFIYKGPRKACLTLHTNLGFCFNILYSLQDEINGQTMFSLKSRGWNIINYPLKLLRMCVGLPSYIQAGYTIDPVFLMEMDRHLSIYDNYWHTFDKRLYQYLQTNINIHDEQREKFDSALSQRQEYLIFVTDKINEAWKARFEQIKQQVTERLPQRQFDEICHIQKTKVEQQILCETRFDPTLFQQLKLLLVQEQVIRDVCNEFRLRTDRSQKTLREQMESVYTIRKHSPTWFEKHYDVNVEALRENSRQHMLEKLQLKLKTRHFDSYMRMMDDYQAKLQFYKTKTVQYRPTRTFIINYKLFPPYRVECRDGVHYQLIKDEDIQVPTDVCGWKLNLFFTRYFCWVKGVMYWAYRNMFVGKLGLMILLGCRKFYPMHMVNPQSGEVGRYSGIERTPIAFQVAEMCQYIHEARLEFEESPDTGFFGKVCGRLYQLFFLYFIVMVLYVVGYLIIIKPLLILTNVLFSLVLLLTAFIWMPLVLLLYWLFTLLIYNLDHDFRKDGNNECSQLWFPLISSTLKLLLDALVFVVTLIYILVSPFLSVLLAVLAVVRYILRRIYDQFTYCIIKCFARAPTQDTWIAWKVAGPGVSRNYYQTIHQADLYVLVIAELEKVRLQLYQKKVTEMLKRPYVMAETLAAQFAQELNTYPTFIEAVQPPIHYYINKLNSQVDENKKNFPQLPGQNIRFTQAEIDLYATNTKTIMKQLIKKHPELDVFGALKVKSRRLDKAVVALWERIFDGPSVFEHLQNIDERFEVNKPQNTQFQEIVSKINRDFNIITKGRFEAERQERERTPFVYKPVIKIKDDEEVSEEIAMFQRVSYKDVIGWIKASSAESLPDSKSSPEYSIIPNINILSVYEHNKEKIQSQSDHPTC